MSKQVNPLIGLYYPKIQKSTEQAIIDYHPFSISSKVRKAPKRNKYQFTAGTHGRAPLQVIIKIILTFKGEEKSTTLRLQSF